MTSPQLLAGTLLSPSSAVPPALGTTMESNQQQTATAIGGGTKQDEEQSHFTPGPHDGLSQSPAANVNGSSAPSLSVAPPAAATTVAGSIKKKKEGAGGPPKSKAYANPLASRADEIKYRTKYKQLRVKVKEIEEENAKTQAKILKTKRQIQRLRLERSILYDRFNEAKTAGTLENTNVPVSSLQAQLATVPFSSLNGSNHLQHSAHQPHLMQQQQTIQLQHQHHPQPQSHQHQQQHQLSPFHQSLSQGYHPSQFTTHPGLMHDSSDTLMMNALQHDLQGVDPTMSMSL